MISQIGVEPESLGKITVQGCKRGWYLSDPGLKGRFRIKLVPIRKEGNSSEAALALVIMIRWGTLGARDQYSHGIVTADLPASLLDHAEKALVNTKTSTPPKGLSLADFFFFTGKPKTGQADKNLPIKIRYSIRNSLRLGRQTKLVVLEAGNQLKWIALELKRIKEVHLHVVHPNEIKWINQSSAKTEKIDARKLARLARGDKLPRKVHIVEGTLRQLRELISAQQTLQSKRVALINSIRGCLKQEGYRLPEKFFNQADWRGHLERMRVDDAQKLILTSYMNSIESLLAAEAELTGKILAVEHEDIERLQSIPGIGGLTSRAIVSAVDDVRRFDSKKEL